jgi:enoyl-CoA hydratase/carnithine racemase
MCGVITLLAHAVGSGKPFKVAASGMMMTAAEASRNSSISRCKHPEKSAEK